MALRQTAYVAAASTCAVLAWAPNATAGHSTAPNGDTLRWDVRLTTTEPHHGVGLADLSGSYTSRDGSRPRSPIISRFRFPRGFMINDRYFPSCPLTPARCPASTEMGAGQFMVDGRPAFPIIPAKFREFLGARDSQGHPTEVDEITVGTATFQQILPFTYDPVGPFGIVETLDVLKRFGSQPHGVAIGFRVREPDKSTIARIHGRRVRIHLYETPPTCDDGSWEFAAEHVFPDGQTLRATDKVPCRRSR
jgi:hypothetical protein